MRISTFFSGWLRPRLFLNRALLGAAVGLLPLGAATAQSATFTLTSSTPRGLSHWGTRLELNFSQRLDPATWAGIDVFVGGKHAINTKGAGANDRQVIVTLGSPPAPGAEITVSVPATVRSLGAGGVVGTPLANPSVLAFTAPAGAGAGTYALASRPALPGTNPTDVQLCDVDGDGDLDACVASTAGGWVDILLNDGSGQLRELLPRLQVGGVPAAKLARCADLDNDGDADMIIASNTMVWTSANDGTGHFGAPVVVGGPQSGVYEAGCADLDADGDLDIYFSDTPNNRIRTYLNDAGAFGAPPLDVPCPGAPTGVACTDMNNDGRPDFVAACRDNGQVAILLWQLSQWLPARVLPTGAGSNPRQVVTGDFDGDGFSDFVVSCDGTAAAGGAAAVDGSVQTWASTLPAFVKNFRKMKLAEIKANCLLVDVDGDGDRDILCVEDNALITCFNGKYTAQGTFSDGAGALYRTIDSNGQTCTGPRRPPGSVHRMATGDLDGDGDLDAVTLGPESLSVLENTPIQAIKMVSPPAHGTVAAGVIPVKWSAPEVLDISTSQGVIVRDNLGRSYTPGPLGPVGPAPDGGAQLNLPGEGKACYELTVSNGTRTTTGKAIRPFSWAFDIRPDQSNGVFVSDGSVLALAPAEISTMGDWDNDGRNDMVSARPRCPNPPCPEWDIKTSKGGITAAARWGSPVVQTATPILNFTPTLIRCADLDADGHLDVVVAGISSSPGSGGPHVKVFDGASGQLVEVDDYALTSPATALLLGDLDFDGNLEIVTCDGDGLKTRTKSNQSNERSYPMPGPITAAALDLGDHTGEAVLYLTIGAGPGGGPHVRRIPVDNTGVARSGEATRFGVISSNPQGATVADLDGDGVPDVMTSTPLLHAVHTLKGIARYGASGSATGRRTIPTGPGSAPTQVCAADIDGDDDRDLVVVCPGNSTIWVGVNDGAGNFPTSRTVAVGAVPQEAWLGDCDADGARDLVVRCADGSVRVFEVGAPSPLDLVISTPVTVPAGTYNSITVLDGGEATLSPIAGGTVAGIVVASMRVKNKGNIKGSVIINNAFVLEDGATMHIEDPAGLSANGAFGPVQGPLNALYDYGDGATFIFDGADPTLRQMGSGFPARIDGLVCDAPGGVNQNTPSVSVRRRVEVLKSNKQGDPNANRVVLESGPEGTAYLWTDESVGARFLGSLTVQTYLGSGPQSWVGYRHLGSPVIGTLLETLACTRFQPVVNPAYNTAPNPFAVRPFPNVFRFEEGRLPGSTDFASGYASPPALGAPMPVGRGLSVYCPGNITPDFSGEPAFGDVPISNLARTAGSSGADTDKSGWQLLANPYACPFDWDDQPATPGLSNAISVWESSGTDKGRYLTRVGGLGSLPDGLLPIGQGFFTRVTGPGPVVLLMRGDGKKKNYVGHVTLIKQRPARDGRPALTLAVRDATGGGDETTVYVQAGATAAFDTEFDAPKPGRNVGVATLATLAATAADELAVSGFAPTDLATGLTIELLVVAPAAGTYHFRVPTVANLDGTPAVLLDRLTGLRHDLHQAGFRVPVQVAQAGEVRGRFALELNGGRPLGTTLSAATVAGLQLTPNPATSAVRVTGAPAHAALTLFDAVGRVVRTAGADALGAGALDLRGLAPGVYLVRAAGQRQRLVVE